MTGWAYYDSNGEIIQTNVDRFYQEDLSSQKWRPLKRWADTDSGQYLWKFCESQM